MRVSIKYKIYAPMNIVIKITTKEPHELLYSWGEAQ